MSLTTAAYSFIRFDSNSFVLPVLSGDTLAFQVRTESNKLASDFSVAFKTSDFATTIAIANTSITKEGVLMNISFDITGSLVYDKRYVVVIFNNGITQTSYTSNEFVYDSVVSTVMTYSNPLDHLDFGYETSIAVLENKVRLPIRFYNQTPATTTSKYTKSSGQIVTFGNTVSDFFELETEYMNADFHRCMQGMLLHRTIQATVNGSIRSFQLAEDYTVSYPNRNFGLATATAKVSSF